MYPSFDQVPRGVPVVICPHEIITWYGHECEECMEDEFDRQEEQYYEDRIDAEYDNKMYDISEDDYLDWADRDAHWSEGEY